MTTEQPTSLRESTRAVNARMGEVLVLLVAWTGIIISVIIAANVVSDYSRIHLPGASTALFWTCLALAAACIVLLLPPVFRQLPPRSGWGVLGLFVALIVAASTETNMAFEAYMRTDAGKQEQLAVNAAAEREKAAAAEADRRLKASPEYAAQQAEAAAEKQAKDAEGAAEAEQKVASCIGWSGHLPALEDPFKESLHNPDAFQHIETTATEPDVYGHNVAMQFRAENGFGAIRTGTVTAKVNPDDCSVSDIGKAEVD